MKFFDLPLESMVQRIVFLATTAQDHRINPFNATVLQCEDVGDNHGVPGDFPYFVAGGKCNAIPV
jgi:uncharacterized protein involved in type VI secretion and phage assembly